MPVLLTATPPIFDYPNHLARIHVMDGLAQSPFFQNHFAIQSYWLPNVLADLVLLALMPVSGIIVAGKLLLILTFALTVGGAYLLNRAASGRYSPWPLLTGLLLYNEAFFWGFLNFNLGVGLLLLGMAVWLLLEGRRPWQLAVGCTFALLTFFAHLVAFGLFAVALAALELWRVAAHWPGPARALRRLLASAVLFIPPLAIFLAASPSGKLDLAARFDFSLFGKVMPFTRLLSSGNPVLDLFVLGSVIVLLLGGMLLRRTALEPRLLLITGLFLALIAGLPYTLMGSFFVDSRIVGPFVLLLAASMVARRPAGMIFPALLLGLLAIRSAGLVVDWREQDRDYARVLAALDDLPDHSVVVTAVGHRFELGDWTVTRRTKPSHEHTTLYATIRKDILVPNMFARPGQNPMIFDSRLDELNRVAHNPVPRTFNDFDARWLIEHVRPIAEHRHDIDPPISGVFVIGYHVPCSLWTADMPVRQMHCDGGFSLIQVLADDEMAQATLLPGRSEVQP